MAHKVRSQVHASGFGVSDSSTREWSILLRSGVVVAALGSSVEGSGHSRSSSCGSWYGDARTETNTERADTREVSSYDGACGNSLPVDGSSRGSR
jgi:hypothetical protein